MLGDEALLRQLFDIQGTKIEFITIAHKHVF
jgi:hypothetical protein